MSTYHAFAGELLREFGPLLPVEPDARLLSETERWQLALDVVNAHPGRCRSTRTWSPSPRWCCGCPTSWRSIWSTPRNCGTHLELERLVHLPAGPRQRGGGPNRRLLDMLDTQTERAAWSR